MLQCPRCKREDVPRLYTADVSKTVVCTYCAPHNSTEGGVPIPWTPSEELKDIWAQQDAEKGTIPDGPPSLHLLQLDPRKKRRR